MDFFQKMRDEKRNFPTSDLYDTRFMLVIAKVWPAGLFCAFPPRDAFSGGPYGRWGSIFFRNSDASYLWLACCCLAAYPCDMDYTPLLIGLTLLVHVPFLVNSYLQLVQDWRPRFRKWSMPRWFPFLLVPLQLALNGLLWLPQYRILAAAGLGAILLAAVMTLTRYYEKREAYYLPVSGCMALALWFGLVP